MSNSKTKLHIVGSSGATERLNQYARIKPEMPPKPKGLSKVANSVWESLGPQLVEAGLLTIIDGAAFSLHCRNVADMDSVMEKLECIDAWVAKTPNDYLQQSVWWTIRNRLHDDILKTSREFGMTPSSRSSIKAAAGETAQQDMFNNPTQPAPADPYAGFGARKS